MLYKIKLYSIRKKVNTFFICSRITIRKKNQVNNPLRDGIPWWVRSRS